MKDASTSAAQKIGDVAKVVLMAAATAFLYWINPSICAVGFIVGIVFDDHISLAINKIKNVIITQPLGASVLGGLACLFSLPVSLATASLLWPAHLGTLMSRKASTQPR